MLDYFGEGFEESTCFLTLPLTWLLVDVFWTSEYVLSLYLLALFTLNYLALAEAIYGLAVIWSAFSY